MTKVVVVIGAGLIGQAIARRVSVGKHVVLADLRMETAEAVAKVLSDAGFEVSTATVDVSSRPSIEALVETAHGDRRYRWRHPCRWRLPHTGVASDDPRGRSQWRRPRP